MAETLLAGAARAPITGTGRYGLGGPGRRRASGIHDDVHARCFVLSDGTTAAALLALDIRGIPAPIAGAIRAQVQRRITSHRLMLLAAGTGTASGPDVLGEGRGCGRPYMEFLLEQAAEVVVCALRTLEPVDVAVVSAGVPTDVLADGRQADPGPLTVITAVAPGGRPVATAAVLGCRPDVLGRGNTEVSADFLHAYHTAVEAARGGLSLALPGAVGDQAPRETGGRTAAEAFDAARRVGEAFATPVLHAVAVVEPIAPAAFAIERCHADLTPAATWAGRKVRFRSVLAGAHGRVRAQAHVLRLGEYQLCMVPGAPTSGAAAQVRERMSTEGGAVVGGVNGMYGLLAPPEMAPPDNAAVWPQAVAATAWPLLRDALPIV